MTLRLPAEFPPWLVESLVGYFPDADEDGMRELSFQFFETRDSLLQLADQQAEAAARIPAMAGKTQDALSETYSLVERRLRDLAAFADSLAEQLTDAARQSSSRPIWLPRR
jgi:hypothetical protein